MLILEVFFTAKCIKIFASTLYSFILSSWLNF